MNVRALKLCLVTHLRNQPFQQYKPFLLNAIRGGITSIQLREKMRDLATFRFLALQMKLFLSPFRIPLIINDHVEIAKEIDAEGVHIGQTDLSPHLARKILGPNKIIGWSVESIADVALANQFSCLDYIAASAIYPSKTKPDCKKIWGINGLQEVTKISKHPVIGIGGINTHNVKSIIESGARGIAVIGAIHDNPDPAMAASDLLTEINSCEKVLCFKKH